MEADNKAGVAALILAVLSYGAIMVSMAAFGGVETPVVGMFLGVLYILCGITGGFLPSLRSGSVMKEACWCTWRLSQQPSQRSWYWERSYT
jgi:hypothetical protein